MFSSVSKRVEADKEEKKNISTPKSNKKTPKYSLHNGSVFRTPVRVTPTSEEKSSSTSSSSTAKRILDILEKLPAPVNSTPRMSPYTRSRVNSPLLHNESGLLNSSTRSGRPYSPLYSMSPGRTRNRDAASRSKGPPLHSVHPVLPAKITPNYHKAPKERFAYQRPDSAVQPNDTTASGLQRPGGGDKPGKMKTKKDRGYYSSYKRPGEDDEMPETPNLPTNFVLPVTQMPQLDLGLSSPAAASSPGISSPSFTFHAPIQHTSPGIVSPMQTHDFSFSSPGSIDSIMKRTYPSSSKENIPTSGFTHHTPSMKSTVPSLMKSSSISGSSSLNTFSQSTTGSEVNPRPSVHTSPVPRSTGSVKFGDTITFSKTASDSPFKTGSCLDVLGIKGKSSTEKKPTSTDTSLSSLFKKAEGTWGCPTCMIQNKPEINKCPACETAKPLEKPKHTKTPVQTSSTNGWGGLFTKSEGSWDCPTCMIQNKPDIYICPACETAKPAGKTQSSATPATGWDGMFKKTKGTWDCPTCMVQNKPDSLKCPACETAKPPTKENGLGNTSSQAPPSNWGGLFKKSEGTWDCPTCMVQNKPDMVKCIACETPRPAGKRPSSAKTDSSVSDKKRGGWDCEDCMTSNKAAANVCAACKASKPGPKAKKQRTLPAAPSSPTWDCPICWVTNKSKLTKCIACEAPKPGLSKKTSSFTSKGGFEFKIRPGGGFSLGPSTTSSLPEIKEADVATTKLPAANFTFGAKSENEDTNKDASKTLSASGGFTFGSTSTPSAITDSKKSNPISKTSSDPDKKLPILSSMLKENDGSAKTPLIPQLSSTNSDSSVKLDSAAKPSNTPSAGITSASTDTKTTPFQFGTTALNKNDTKLPSVAGGFQFGKSPTLPVSNTGSSSSSQNSTQSSIASASTTQAPAIAGGFQFSATSSTSTITTTSSDTKPAPSGLFQFGAPVSSVKSKSTPSTGSLQFGVTTKTDTAPTGGGFQFGTNTTTATSTTASTGLFQFGAAPTTKSETAPTSGLFQFGAAPSKPTTAAPTTKSETVPTSAAFQFGATASKTNTTASTGAFQFGAKSTATADTKTSSGVFQFGTNAPTTNEKNTSSAGGFSFGATSTKESTAPLSGGFQFNAKPPAAADTKLTTAGGFQFGAAPSSNATGTSQTAGMFQFGATNTQNNAAAARGKRSIETEGSSAKMSKSGFSFGSTPSAPGSSTTFGTGSTAPGFGQATKTETPGFQFGAPAQNQQPAQSGAFQFGATTAAAPPAPAATAPQAGGFNFNAAAPASFNFGASGGGQSSDGGGGAFQFSASGSSAPAAPAATGGRRPIRKAVRKLKQ